MAEELTIRSRCGWLRDLLPVYEPWYIVAAAGALAFMLWLGWLSGWHLPPILLLFAALQWNSLFQMRPSAHPVARAGGAGRGGDVRRRPFH